MGKEAYVAELPILAANPSLPEAGWHKLFRVGPNLYSMDSAGVTTPLAGTNFPITITQGGTGQTTAGPAKDALTVKSSDIAAAATTDLSTASGDFVDITGAATITSFGTAPAGVSRVLRFTGACTLTHNATSLILIRGVAITTKSGDTAIFRSLGGGNWLCVYFSRVDEQQVERSWAAPGATTSTGGVMMGLDARITPRKSGRVLVTISGDSRNTTNVKGCIIQARYGTGASPANGSALTGTLKGYPVTTVGASVQNREGFSRTLLLTGLTIGTAIWFDVSLAANNSGTASIAGIEVVMVEI